MAEQILTFYNRYFTIKYPFGKLDVLAVPDFAAGAMENTAAIFYRETDLLVDSKDASLAARKRIASVLAHEMAHQWFGDLVTMKWWDDIWLNEGFATWMANHALAEMRPDWDIPVDEVLETQAALNFDGLKSTHPIHAPADTPAQIDEAFDAIAYEKGAAVLRMLENYLGAGTFRNGINAYLQAHAYGNGTSQDFWNAMTAASGKPVDRILPTFVNQPGAPLVEVAPACRDNRMHVDAVQQRFFQDPALLRNGSAERWQVPVCMKSVPAAGGGATNSSCAVFSQPRQSLTLDGSACSPWVFANAGAQGYYRTAYSPEALRALTPRVQDVLTAPERLSLAGDEWAMVRAGRHGIGEFLTLATGFGNERTDGVLGNVTNRLDFIHDYLTTDATRVPVRTVRADAVRAPVRAGGIRLDSLRQRRGARPARHAHRDARNDRRRRRPRGPRARRSRPRARRRTAARPDARRGDRRRGGRTRRPRAAGRAARGRRQGDGSRRALPLPVRAGAIP